MKRLWQLLLVLVASPILTSVAWAVAPVSFGPKTDFTTGTNPASVAMCDLNGDGKLDLVVANRNANTISVFLGDGAGSFGAKTDFATGNIPFSVATGDLNGDGKLDVVVANSGAFPSAPGNVSVLLGDGAGGFSPRTDYPGATEPYHIAIGDLNGDGNLDLVVANVVSHSFSVFLGDGLGGFGPKTDFPVGGSATSTAIADLNGDGKLDLAVTNQSGNVVSVFLGDGAGGFGAKTDYPAGTGPISIALRDLNDDGQLDAIVANSGSNNVSLLIGDGLGGFGPKTDYAVGSVPRKIVVGDLNLDGQLDLAVANSNLATVSVLLADGVGGFIPKTDFTTGTNPFSVAIGDVNGDGKPDLVSANYNANTVSVLLNTSVGIVESPPTFVRTWGTRGTGPGQFIRPTAMVADTAGNLIVLDVGKSTLQKFGPDGTFLWEIGSHGHGDAQFFPGTANNYNSAKSNTAGIIAVDSSGTIYVLDAGNSRIQRFGPDGAFLGKWGTYGSSDGQFNSPCGVVVGDKHMGGGISIYALDAGNERIQKFSDTGVFQAKWGSCGIAPGEFNGPCGAVISDKHMGGAISLYVLDKGNKRVQEFTEDGVFVKQWGTQGFGPGQFSEPRAIFTAGDDRECPLCPPPVYVLDTGNNAIEKFSGEGAYLSQMGVYGSGNGSLNVCGDPIPGVDVSLEQIPGGICVTDGGNGAIHKFSVDGTQLTQWGTPGSGLGEFNGPCGVVVGDKHMGGGISLYVLDAGNCRIQQFTQTVNVTAVTPVLPGRSPALQLSAWPNPSQKLTNISFTLPTAGPVTVAIYDVVGRRIRHWDLKTMPAGEHQLQWNGLSDDGHRVASGVVFYRLQAGGQTLRSKILRLQ